MPKHVSSNKSTAATSAQKRWHQRASNEQQRWHQRASKGTDCKLLKGKASRLTSTHAVNMTKQYAYAHEDENQPQKPQRESSADIPTDRLAGLLGH
jgi:hypothetical protein